MTAANVVDTDDIPAKKSPVKKKRGTATKRRPAEHVELPKPEDVAPQAPSPYPKGVMTWAYQPAEANSEPILLALSGFGAPPKVWYFDLAQLPRLTQTWRWMEFANIPKAIQRQAQLLPDVEYFAMMDKWFEAIAEYRKSDPKGAATSGK